MFKRITLALFVVAILSPLLCAADTIDIKVSAGDYDRMQSPVSMEIELPKGVTHDSTVAIINSKGVNIPGQLTAPSVASDVPSSDNNTAILNFVLPVLNAGGTASYTVHFGLKEKKRESFVWKTTGDKYDELSFGDRPVLRFMREPVDDSTPERRGETYKVYHHVYDPAGKKFITKGPGGLFPHHRGLFFGFNRISYNGKKADIWHCRNGESQTFEETISQEVGPVLGRHKVKIAWRGTDGKTFATETREMTAWNVRGGELIEFATKLETEVGEVKLDGDPQHAGFQFRATQKVPDKTKAKTYYLRPDGKGEPGKYRNWGKKGDTHANLAWNTLCFVLDDERYSVCYLDRLANPKEARFSERDYGRFGSYFEYMLSKDKPLILNYRIWVQKGEKTVKEVEALSHDFVAPPTAS